MINTKIKLSKDNIHPIKQDFSTYTSGSYLRMVISDFKPKSQRDSNQIESVCNVIETFRNLIIASFTTTQKDNVAEGCKRPIQR